MFNKKLSGLLIPTAIATTALTLSAPNASAQYASPGSCSASPKYAYNGQVPIRYPKGRTQSLRQVCDAATAKAAKELMAEAKSKGMTIKWIEFYEALLWNHSFGDLIYKLRPMGFSQADYKSWKETATYPEANTLIYANERTGKYVGRIRIGDNRNTRFILFGN